MPTEPAGLVLFQLNLAMFGYAVPSRGAEEERDGRPSHRPAASPDPERTPRAQRQAAGPLAAGAHPPAVPGDRRGGGGEAGRRSRRARGLPLHPGVRLGPPLQPVGLFDLRAGPQPQGPAADPRDGAAARADRSGALLAGRAGPAILGLVGGQAHRVLPSQEAPAADQRRVGPPAAPARGHLGPAHPHLEDLERSPIRPEKNGSSSSPGAARRARRSSATTSGARSS